MSGMIEKKVNCRMKLDILHGFGSLCSQGLKSSVCIIEEDQKKKILFPLGRYFALKSHDSNEEQFLKLPENTQRLVCMTVSPNRKYLAASVEIKNDSFPQIIIYNIANQLRGKGDREKTFRFTETKSQQFLSMAFCGGDARFLVCLTGAPSFQLIFLDVHKQCKQVGLTTLSMPVYKMSINPKENHTITLSGKNLFKILRVQENQFKQLNEISNLPLNQGFTDHDWLDESYLVIGTDKGTVYIVENYGVQEIFENSFNESNVGICALTAFSKGFIIGSERGHVALYLKMDEYNDGVEDYKFMLRRTFMCERQSAINHISISSKNDLAAMSFRSNDIATFELAGLVSQTTSKYLNKQKDINFDYLFNGFHSGPISSLDVCLQRPLILTCSRQDSSIRVWNYASMKCELASKFFVGESNSQQDVKYNPLLCVAFHPFGYYIAAAFVDKISFFHLLHSELRPYREIMVKNCILLRYSNGGQYIAAAYNKNKNSYYYVSIYNAYTGELRTTLKGHSGVITDIAWDHHDQELYTVGTDGYVFLYETKTWSRKDYQQTNSKFQGLIFAERGVKVVVGQEDGENIVREIRQEEFSVMMDSSNSTQADKNNTTLSHQGEKSRSKAFPMGPTHLTCMTYLNSLKNHQAIIAGCDQGFIRIHSSIFNQKPFETQSSHSGAITRVSTSPDGRYVFTGGEDGCLFIYQVSETNLEGQLLPAQGPEEEQLNPRALVVDEQLADVVLVSRAEIEEYLNMQRQLKTEIEDLENKIEQKHYEEKGKFMKQKKEAEEKMHRQIESFNLRYEDLKQQKQEVEKDYNNLLKNMENNHLKAVEELENLYEKKLAYENEKYIHLESKVTEERIRQKQEVEQLGGENRKNLGLIKGKFEEKFSEVRGLYEITRENAIELEKTFTEKLGQQEDEYEIEIEAIRQKQKQETDALRMEISQMRAKQELLSQDYKNMKEDLEQSDNYKKDMKHSIEKLSNTLSESEERIRVLVKELKEQEDKLRKKEKKIYEYKYKISDLQKAKHVLSFRTAEMRSGIQPKEAQIEKLKEELFKLEGEFENMLRTSQKQNDDIKKLNNQVAILQNSLQSQVEATKKKQSTIDSMTMEVYNTVNGKDVKEWALAMKHLYQKYVDDKDIKRVKQDPKGVEERQRQIHHLENCIDQIHVSSNNIIKRREIDIRKKTMENAVLIYDLNQIRKKNKEYDIKLTSKTTKLEHKNNEIKNLRKEITNLQKQQNQAQNEKYYGAGEELLLQQNNFMQNSQRVQSSITFNRTAKGAFQAKPQEKKINGLVNQYVSAKMGSRPTTGKICKGSNYDRKTMDNFDKAKHMDLQVSI